MISVLCSGSRLCTAVLIFYTCVWIPFLQLKRALLRLLGSVFPWYHHAEESCCQVNVCLPVARFEDLELSNEFGLKETGNDGEEVVEEVCSICLVEFEKEDVVSQLHSCRHVFHMNCIEKWLDRDRFTCPLCRSFLLANLNPCREKCGTTPPPPSSHRLSSWLSF